MISVVVPTRGDAGKLDGLLGALEAQTLPRERFEVLLAVDGATPSPELEARVVGLNGRVLSLAERRGPGAARNVAAALARGEWLALTEDDVVPAPDWLERAEARMSREPAPDVIEGLTVLPGGRALRNHLVGLPQFIPTNLFVRRSWYARVGGYEEAFFDAAHGLYFREDSDFGFKLEEARAVIVHDDTVRVTHPDEHPGFWDPMRWAARYEMDPLLALRHPRLFRERIEVHQVGPVRVRRPIVRACVGAVLAVLLALALAVAGRGASSAPLLAIAVLCMLAVWAKWKFHPLRLPMAFLVPPAMTVALLRGQFRAAAWAKAREQRKASP